MMSSWVFSGLALAMLLTSCVAKKKYVEAQNTITELRQQNADCMVKGDSLNQSLSSLNQANNELQRRYDSTTTAFTSSQSTWNNYTSYYDKQVNTVSTLHQQLHQQLDEKIGAENIASDNKKVYVTLPEGILFTAGSTNLSTKGKDIINTLALAIAQNPEVEVNVATSAIYNGAGMAITDTDPNANVTTENKDVNVATDDADKTYSDKSASKTTKSSAAKKSTASHKTSTAKKSPSKYKSETGKKTMRSNYASAKKPAMSSSSMAVARASSVVSALRENGVIKAGIQVTDPLNKTSMSARKYQVIVSPSMEGYYEMMGKGSLGTGMK